MDLAEGREPVEPDRGVRRGVRAGRMDTQPVARLQVDRQPGTVLLVEDVDAVTRRSGQ